jgi:hypothetical protein
MGDKAMADRLLPIGQQDMRTLSNTARSTISADVRPDTMGPIGNLAER